MGHFARYEVGLSSCMGSLAFRALGKVLVHWILQHPFELASCKRHP